MSTLAAEVRETTEARASREPANVLALAVVQLMSCWFAPDASADEVIETLVCRGVTRIEAARLFNVWRRLTA